MLASNYDDHLRNHGFLMHAPGRWSLSPAYDLNPVPEIDRIGTWKMPISESRDESSIGGAVSVAPRFGLTASEAMAILRQVFGTVCDCRKTARTLKLPTLAVQAYASAFYHTLMDEARSLLKG